MRKKQQLEQVAIEALIPYARNARKHSDEQVAQIAASIREFGFNAPVLVDADLGIIAGHGRVLAARKLGLEKVPCIRLGHLTDTQRRAYILADNKLAMNAEWDEEFLKLEVIGLNESELNLGLTGFDASDLSRFIASEERQKSSLVAEGTGSQNKNSTGSEDEQQEGAKELSEDSFDDFDHQCPRCGFEFNAN